MPVRVAGQVVGSENSRKRERDFACNSAHVHGYDNAQSAGGLAVTVCRHAAGRVSTQKVGIVPSVRAGP